MRRRTAIVIGLVTIVAMAGGLMTPVTLVRVTGPTGERMVCERVTGTSTIALTFTHSMYGGDVTETYIPAGGDTLERISIFTGNAAAAEYYARDGAVREIDGRYEVIVPDEEFETLAVRVDGIGNHRLTVDGETYDLAEMAGESAQVRLSTVTRPLATQVFGSRC